MSFDDIFEQINDVIDNPVKDRTDQKTQYVAFVLDMSGSMDRIRDVAIDSFNEQLQQLRKEDDIETRVITTVFNDAPVNMSGVDVVPLEDVEELTKDTYVPNGMTALYDAIGFTVNKVIREYKEDDTDTAVLFVVITDGQENDSKEYHQSDIKRMVEELEGTERWTFTFMGANQNPLETAVEKMSFSVSNTLQWQSDNVGMQKMSADVGEGVTAYYNARRAGETMTANFFDSKTDDGLVDSGSKTDDGSDEDSKTDDLAGGQTR